MKKITIKIQREFETDLSPMDCRLFREDLHQLTDLFLKREGKGKGIYRPSFDEKSLSNGMIAFLVHMAGDELDRIGKLRNLQSDFNRRFASSNTETERRELILKFAKDLGSSPGSIRGDRRAFKRWFGYDAVLQRCTRKIFQAEYGMVFLLNRLCAVASKALSNTREDVEQERILNHINMDKSLKPLLAYRGDERVRIETFRCMAGIIRHMSPRIKTEQMEESIIVFIYRASLDARQQIWIQCETLALLSLLDQASFIRAAGKRLFHPAGGDDFFVRRKAVQLLCDHIYNERGIKRFVPTISRDISPFVRQAVPSVLIRFLVKQKSAENSQDIISWLHHMLLKDISPQVRAAAILEIASSLDLIILYIHTVSNLFFDHFSLEKDSFVLRVGFKTVVDTVVQLKNSNLHSEARNLMDRLLPLIAAIHQSADDLSVRRWAAYTRERLLVERDEQASLLMVRLQRCILDIKPGTRRRMPKSWFNNMDEEKTGRVLAVLAWNDFSLGLEKKLLGVYVFRGDRFRFQVWRFLHELFSSSPDKRQGFSHTIGRKYPTCLRAPSAIGSELTQTKVPGEPLYYDTESGWRPYLPLVDEALSCSKKFFSKKPDRIFTVEGITEIHPPRSMLRTCFACIALTLGFSKYAKLRNWQEKSREKSDSYINGLRRLGFSISFSSHKTATGQKDEDPSVVRFFTISIPFISPDLWNRIHHYFFSAYENSLYELGFFAAILLVFFLSKHLYYSYVVKRARKKINVVIGGWGTRGKSGVERLKASVFEALGHGFINKTTGCEAMFLHAFPYGKTREMFLFRPYDKATIWEHHHLICMTRKLRSKMFLWECMALTPDFVSVLQHQWTRDDYSTITNTYPDHEDIQGPAGINIPQVMTNFIPAKGTLVTSEEEMTPILTHAAKEKSTTIQYTGWLESGMLTPDVLDRFPYEEHPSNVALVLKLFQMLNIDPDFAVREMADRVVPDIGALKVFPTASLRNRQLEFINGMSANERFATISNWRRMGFEDHDHERNPEIILSTLVNNRADRIPRSRMFASIIVNDLSADYHFLIGSNLSGMLGFINTAWENTLKKISIYSNENDTMDSSVEIFRTMARRMRIPTSSHSVARRITAMLEGLGVEIPENDIHDAMKEPLLLAKLIESIKPGMEREIKEIIRFVEQWNEELKEFKGFEDKIQREFQAKELDAGFKKLITKWFRKKLMVIDNIHVTGNQIINIICNHTPPGLHNKIMGLQNIKGPGLDYVYRWQAWETCYLAGQNLLNDRDQELFEQGFFELTSFQDYGILCEDYVLDIISKTTGKAIAQTEKYQAGLSLIKSNLGNAMDKIKATLKSEIPKNSIKNRIAGVVESLLDAGDAVKRRKKANQIYKDLIHERISHERAAMELKKLNQRQKGGWLSS